MKQIIIDVREPEEYESGHVVGALNITPDQLIAGATMLSGFPKDTPLVIYCRTGSRSSVAMNILRQLGYTNLTNGINQQQVEAHLTDRKDQ